MAVTERRRFAVDLLYADQVGAQRTISRLAVIPVDAGWLVAAARHRTWARRLRVESSSLRLP